MRTACLLLLVLCVAITPRAFAQDGKRHGVAVDAKTYPQATAKEALASVLKAVADKKFDYLVAQLAEPAFVDDRVKRVYAGKFAEQVADTMTRLDPRTVKRLGKFLKSGKWTVAKASALVTLADDTEHVVRLVKIGDRWYLSNRNEPTAKD